MKVGQFTSNSITLNIGAPQGCVLSPLLYSLYTHDCVSSHSSTSIVKVADDTVVLGLISNNDETAYLDELESSSKNQSLWTSPFREPCEPSLLWLVRWRSPLWLVYRVQREWQPWADIIYSSNRIRLEFLMTRLGDCKMSLFFIWLTITLFIVLCRIHNFAESLFSHTATWHTAWKGIFKKPW